MIHDVIEEWLESLTQQARDALSNHDVTALKACIAPTIQQARSDGSRLGYLQQFIVGLPAGEYRTGTIVQEIQRSYPKALAPSINTALNGLMRGKWITHPKHGWWTIPSQEHEETP